VHVSRIKIAQSVVRIYMWVLLQGIEVAQGECVDVSGCVLLRIEVANINGRRAHYLDFN